MESSFPTPGSSTGTRPSRTSCRSTPRACGTSSTPTRNLAGVFRILVIGDSFVFGAGGVEASNRFADILAKSAKNVEVINTGVPGYGADQEYLYLKTEGLKYHPDLVLLCAFYNDFSESFSTINPSIGRPKGYLSLDGDQLVFHPPSFSTFYELSQHSYVLGLADLALSKISWHLL